MENIEALQSEAKTLWQKEREQAINAAKLYIQAYELKEEDLFARKLPIKYRDGDNVWSGRGLMPKWMKLKIEAGSNREDFKV